MSKETEFSRKMKRICSNRTVIVTMVTLLLVTGVILAATLSANRAKRPFPGGADTGATTAAYTEALPSGGEEITLPTYHGGETQPVDVPPEEDQGGFLLPAQGQLSKGHDASIQVYSTTMGDYRVHLGVDITTAPEAPVFAVAEGKVEKVWADPLMGTCVAISHKNELVSIYKNLARELAEGIAVGATVKQGQQLGSVGDTAVAEMAEEPHVHFEVTSKGLSVDPLEHFREESLRSLSEDTAFESQISESEVTTTPLQTTPVTTPVGK